MEAAPKPKKTIKTIAKTKTAMPEQDPAVRARNWNEVTLGYTEDQALAEAARCIQSKKPGCIAGCPVAINIPGFIQAIENRDFRKAYDVLAADKRPARHLRPRLPARKRNVKPCVSWATSWSRWASAGSSASWETWRSRTDGRWPRRSSRMATRRP